MKRRHHLIKSQRGVGLIEVLIALLVLSFGMLGMAGLQMWSLKYNQSAMERGMAVVETHSIVDAMRADRAAALDSQFNIGLDDSPPTGNTFAQFSVRTWRENLEEVLGEGATGMVECDGSRCEIRVRWIDTRAANVERDADGNVPESPQTVVTWVQL